MADQGMVHEVKLVEYGSVLAADAALSATVITVEDAADFNEDGGQLQITSLDGSQQPVTTTYTYTAVTYGEDDVNDTDTITLSTGLATAGVDGDRVNVYPATVEKVAMVLMDDAGDSVPARIPHTAYAALGEGIRDEVAQEAVQLVLDDNDEWVVTDILGVAPVYDGAYIDPATFVPNITDGNAPVAAPSNISTLGGLGMIFVKWTAPANADFMSYEVHCSTSNATPAVAGDSATRLADLAGTLFAAKHLADGTAFEYDTVYYFALVAKDGDGAGPASAWVAGEMDRAASADLAVGSITAGQLEAVLALVSTLSSRSKDANGELTGAGTDLTTAGLFSYKSDGTTRFELPNDPLLPAVFRGNAEIDNLTVSTLTTLVTSELAQNAVFTLLTGYADPQNAPTVSLLWTTKQFTVGSGSWSTRNGWDTDGTYSYTWNQQYCRMEKYSNSTGLRVAYSNPFFADNITWGTAVYDPVNVKVMLLNIFEGELWLSNFTTGMSFAFENEWRLSNLGGTPPAEDGKKGAVGWDHTNDLLIIAKTRASDLKTVFHRYSMTTGTPSWVGNVASAAEYNAVMCTALRGTFDFGSTHSITGSRNTNGALQIFRDSDGALMTTLHWPIGSSAAKLGAYWSDSLGLFVIMDETGKQWTYEGGGNTWATGGETATWNAEYTWYHTTGPKETLPSPAASFTMSKRAKVRITSPTKPAGITHARFYLQNGAGSYYLQGSSSAGSPNITVLSATFSGTTPPGSSTFGSGTPSEIVSQADDGSNPWFEVRGDGSGRWGELTISSSGYMLGADHHMGRTSRSSDLSSYTTETYLMQATITAVNGAIYKVEAEAPMETTVAANYSVLRTRFGTSSGGITGTVVTNQVLDHRAANRRETACAVGYFTSATDGTLYVKATVDCNGTGSSSCSLNTAYLLVTRIA